MLLGFAVLTMGRRRRRKISYCKETKKSPARASQRGPEGFLSCMFSFYAYVEDLFRFLFHFHDELLHLTAGLLCLFVELAQALVDGATL